MRKLMLTLLILTCSIALSAMGGAKKTVPRPVKMSATVTWVINLADGYAEGHEVGVGTHLGAYTNDGWAYWDLSVPVITNGAGTGVAANGDQVFWRMTPDKLGVVQMLGGTGRFADAVGEIITTSLKIISMETTSTNVTMTVSYTAEGTIKF